MLEPGTYLGTFKSGEACKTRGNKDQVACVFNVTAFAQGGKWVPIEHTERTVYLSLEGGAKEYTGKKLTNLEFDGNFSMSPLGFGKLGQGINLICRHETYNNKLSDKWDLHDWGGGAERKSLSDTEKIQLNAWWQATAPKPEAAETPAPAEASASAPPPTGDEIPF